MSELFIELLSEEIPYWLQKNVVDQFKNKLNDLIIENNLSLSKNIKINSYFTPTRTSSLRRARKTCLPYRPG